MQSPVVRKIENLTALSEEEQALVNAMGPARDVRADQDIDGLIGLQGEIVTIRDRNGLEKAGEFHSRYLHLAEDRSTTGALHSGWTPSLDGPAARDEPASSH